MFLHCKRERNRQNREGTGPRFLVLRRKWLTLAAAGLAAAAIFAAVNYPAAVSASAATRQLPIYCVQRDQKMCAISFDAAWGADISVCGHTHGVLVRIPGFGSVISPQLTPFPKYDGGFYQVNGKNICVSKGLGTHTFHIRIFDRAEVVMLKIN